MGLDMYLYRVPKVETVEQLADIEDRLGDAFIKGAKFFLEEQKKIRTELQLIWDIEFSVNAYTDIDRYSEDKTGWEPLIDTKIRCAYWRKFNALHNWFVKNVQEDKDDCGFYLVDEAKLKELLFLLRELNKKNCHKLFPILRGFFFGSSDYDEWYWSDVERLIVTITHLLNEDTHGTTFLYTSSW